MSKKKYSINWDDDLPTSFEVNGKSYEILGDVPNESDRRKLEAMMDSSFMADFDKEFEEASKQVENQGGPSMEKIVLGIFTAVAVIMLIVTAVSSYSAVSKISKEQSAPGHVVDMIQKREYVNEQDLIIEEYYYPVVEYVSADGRSHTVQLTEGNRTPSYEIGDEVTVLYDPERPLDAHIKSFGSSALMWVLPSITGVLGIAFLVGVIVVRRVIGTGKSN